MMYIRSQADKRNKLYTIQENSHKGCYKQKSEEFYHMFCNSLIVYGKVKFGKRKQSKDLRSCETFWD